MTRLIILSATHGDLICRHVGDQWFEVCSISLVDFIEHVAVHDYCDDYSAQIYWQIGDYIVNNDAETWMLSRLAGVNIAQFAMFDPIDQEFAFAETMAYLGYAVNQFKQINTYCNQHGHENLYALPEQWQWADKYLFYNDNKLLTPDYYWGDPRFNHLQAENLVHSHISNLTLWRPNQRPSIEPGQMLFCFQRPLGEPVFCAVIGNQVLITPVYEDFENIPDKQLAEWARQVSQCFQYVICEVLFFVDGERITLGYISTALIYSERNPWLPRFITRSLDHLISMTVCNESLIRSNHA